MQKYSEHYLDKTFYLWYEGGKKLSQKFINSLPEEDGDSPNLTTVTKWRNDYGWVERAQAMDDELSNVIQNQIIDKRAKMYEEHIEIANTLLTKAREFLATGKIEDMGEALKAIDLATELQKASIGQVEWGRKMMSMSNEQLTTTLKSLLGDIKNENEEFIDVEAEDE